jgi:hypothetical protein
LKLQIVWILEKRKRNIEENRKRKEKQKEPYLGRPIGRSHACGTEIAPAMGGS